MLALIPELNRIILTLAPAHAPHDVAPSTLDELLRAHATDSACMLVWSGGSEHTIYKDARVNFAFRAWHDSKHVAGVLPFTLEGERAACDAQLLELYRRFPTAPADLGRIIRAEVIGQAEFFAEHGSFPEDQEGFVRRYLANGGLM